MPAPEGATGENPFHRPPQFSDLASVLRPGVEYQGNGLRRAPQQQEFGEGNDPTRRQAGLDDDQSVLDLLTKDRAGDALAGGVFHKQPNRSPRHGWSSSKALKFLGQGKVRPAVLDGENPL